MASSKQSRLRALVAIIDAQIVLALAWVETLLQLRELQAQLQTHFLDLMKVDLLHLQERWSAIYWTAEMKEQIPQPDPRLMMVVTAHLSSLGEHGNDEQHHGVSRPHATSHPVDFAQFPFAILTCPTQMVLFLPYPLFSRDPDRQYLCCNTELVATCATQDCLGTARRL